MANFLYILNLICQVLLIIVPLLIAVAYFTLAERKVLSAVHQRQGPTLVGIFGLMQPFADGLKLFLKEIVIPSSANTIIFLLAPILTFMLSLVSFAVVPFEYGMVFADLNVGVLYLFAISSLGVYGIIMAGWASNSKYAFLGALRSAAQMVSYEVSLGLIIICVILCVGSLNLTEIVLAQENIWFVIPLFPLFIMFVISALAETNRPPFDLPEAEAELVAGYYVEYSAMSFALFFLGESANIVLMCCMVTIFFLGGWLPILNVPVLNWIPGSLWFGIKVSFLLFVFVWVRAAFPRYRYDQLMRLGWKVFLPFTLAWVFIVSAILIAFDWLPTLGLPV
uniref:NADH-ubiquinone oxidoreductase chain 1 n=1 Tax=Palpitomonas bilix TaxID=652834 RepID=A0A1E1GHU2_9EUKA|nr:NADH dehydrogenase subunit 1 [Palpitomonas bilix]YP_009317268.1 NADH dehydrogenase subunit 1 [Palpitomonas bilix]BAV82385.1 NADH dehydrogenase subunit 1 [Palpitomonas bilix]BAV82436.1 NADH dehydrogenase subunit 1 [Palpitomonas bilix]